MTNVKSHFTPTTKFYINEQKEYCGETEYAGFINIDSITHDNYKSVLKDIETSFNTLLVIKETLK